MAMDDFSKIYEKLIDMGFSSLKVDSAISLGLYTFDDIFKELVDKENSISDDADYNELKENRNNVAQHDDCTVTDNDDVYIMKLYSGDSTSQNFDCTLKMIGNTKSLERGFFELNEDPNKAKTKVLEKYPKISSSLLPSLLSSNIHTDTSTKNTTNIQVMDLLDPSHEPETYSQPFLANQSTIRDLICWFYQSRNTRKKVVDQNAMYSSRVAISIETDLYSLINSFENYKWHFVLPSGANSQRIYGRQNLEKCLDQLGLVPNAHLLAIVGCPLQLQQNNAVNLSMSNNSHSIVQTEVTSSDINKDYCCVQIKMINYRNNPLYFQGKSYFKEKYDSDTTTLQKVMTDFSNFCQLDISSFLFVYMYSAHPFSYPDDYVRSLRDLGLVGNVTLYCHSRTPTSNVRDQSLSSGNNRSLTFSTWYPSSNTDLSSNNTYNVGAFPGIGQRLEGSPTSKNIRDVWSTRTIKNVVVENQEKNCNPHPLKSLFRLCLTVLYGAIKGYNFPVCREVRRLPNNLQQILIRKLIEEKALTASILTHFCNSSSGLSTLDLSYTVQATNDVLKCVSKCVNLHELILDNEDHVFTNEGLCHIRACINLRRLSLNHCTRINDWGIQIVAKLPKLSVLSIKHTAVTDLGLCNLMTQVNHEGAEPSFVHLPLTSLDLSGLVITDQSLQYLASLPNLELLNIASTAISNPSLFPHLINLHHLNISYCIDLVWDLQTHIGALNESFPALTSIVVAGISDSNLILVTKAVAVCSNLRQIDGLFSHAHMTASLLSSLSHLPLDSIVLSNCSHVNDLWLPVIARFSATLTHLVISYCPNICGNNDSLMKNLGRLSHLSWLDLTHLENVDSQQICQLVLERHFPKMQVVWFSLTEEEEFVFRCHSKHVSFKIHITRSLGPHSL